MKNEIFMKVKHKKQNNQIIQLNQNQKSNNNFIKTSFMCPFLLKCFKHKSKM